MTYRKEIDGLRAIAVLAVIFFHADIAGFSGGFVGVDIFFVISGFLITGLIVKELEQGQFSLANFYLRRTRRILPTLFVVVLLTFPFTWWLMLPHEFVTYAKGLISIPLFSSNFVFWQAENYFAAETSLNPLIHTWSLAVEEQYYMLFPLFMIALWKARAHIRLIAIILLTLCSLVLAETLWRIDTAANFFLLPSRIWQLSAGALMAIYGDKITARLNAPLYAQLLASMGLLIIAVSIIWLSKDVPYPSVYALPPVIGTMLVLVFANSDTWVGRLLSLKPMMAVGLISYSAYLWHQPLFAYAHLYYGQHGQEWTHLSRVVLISSSLILAVASWRWIERPFRQKASTGHGWKVSNTALAVSLISAAVLIIALGLMVYFNQGFPQRF